MEQFQEVAYLCSVLLLLGWGQWDFMRTCHWSFQPKPSQKRNDCIVLGLKIWVRAYCTHLLNYPELSFATERTQETKRANLNTLFKFMVLKSDYRSLACFVPWKK